jgi:CBS domain-containing protein
MNASDVMVPNVITVKPDDTVQEVAALLLVNQISAAVVDDPARSWASSARVICFGITKVRPSINVRGG